MKKQNVSSVKVVVLFLGLMILVSVMCACQSEQTSNNEKTKETSGFTEVYDICQWQTTYLDFLETHKNTHKSFALVYVDDDDIPEIYLHGIGEATGDSICTYKNGALIEQPLHRTGGGWYVEKRGKVINKNGHMGQTHTHVYGLSEDGFELIFEALSSEHINDEKELYFEYSIGDMSVSESEYALAVKDAVELEDAVRFSDVDVDYDTIRQQIINFK